MKTASNPYTIGFGRIPAHYKSRDILIEDIIDNISGDEIQGQAYKLTGKRVMITIRLPRLKEFIESQMADQ